MGKKVVVYMESDNVRSLAKGLVELMAGAGYADGCLAESEWILGKVCDLHLLAGRESYDQVIADAFVAGEKARCDRGEISRIMFLRYARVVHLLGAFRDGEEIEFERRFGRSSLEPAFQAALDSVDENPEWGDDTRAALKQHVRPYLRWLQERGLASMAEVGAQDIRAYFIDAAGRMTPGSVDTIRRSVRKFHAYLNESSLLSSSFSDVLAFSVRPEHKIKKPAQPSETAAALSQVDRATPKGRRDYAMIMLGVVLGLRCVDIVGLLLDDIDWANGEVTVRQSKTGRAVALPLTVDVGEAVRDYIVGGRPDVADRHVFLGCRSPFAPLGRTTPYQVFNVYRAMAGLPKAPFHGLRRAVGTGLVVAGSPVTTVAQILGHSSIDSARQYISLDTPMLKAVALDLGGLPECRWGGAS